MARSSSGKPGSSRSPAGEARKRAAKKKRLLTKRQFRLLATASIVALVVAIGSVAVFAFQRGQEEVYDLSQVGTGVPAVVQVHDFTCPVCTELRETVQVIEDEFTESDLLIRIADVHTDEGLEFASRYTTARRATLLFISGNGELVDVRSGEASAAVLRERFQRHIAGEM
jgi:hypothetical protein